MTKIFIQFLLAGIILGSGQDSKPRQQEVALPDQHIAVPADILEKLKKAERELEQLKRERQKLEIEINNLPSVQQKTERPSV